MRNIFSCLPVLFCLLFSSAVYSQIEKIYLNPKANANARQSQFIDSIRFIPLEIKDKEETTPYTSIQLTDKYFLVTDYLPKTITVYLRNGQFYKKISFKKLGESFYPADDKSNNRLVFVGMNKNYALTEKDQLKIKFDWNSPRNKKYFKKYTIQLDDTTFSLQKDIPDAYDILHTYPYYDDVYWLGQITTSPLYKDSLDYEFKLYRNKQLVKGFFPYNHINEPRFLYAQESVTPYKANSPYVHFISRPYCDTIYKMIRDSVFPAYQVVVPVENSLPASFFTTAFKNKTERQNFERNNGWLIRQVYNFYETPTFLYFQVRYLLNFDSYVYVKKTNTTYKTKNIKPDSSQYNLQLIGDFNGSINGDWWYKLVKAGDIESFFQQNKTVAVPVELENYLNKKPSANAPVIVVYKLKN